MRFLTALFISTLLALLMPGILNYSVDPTGIRELQDIEPACGSGMHTERRWTIPLTLHYNPSGTAISGTSRMMRGFSETSIADYFDTTTAVNAALPSMTADEMYYLLSPAIIDNRIQRMLLGVEFGMFSGRVTTRSDTITRKDSQWKTVRQWFKPYLSLEASHASIRVLRDHCKPSRTHASGFREPKPRRKPAADLPSGFIHLSEKYIAARYQSSTLLPERYQHRLGLFSALLSEGCAQQVKIDMAILPLHQRIHDIYKQQGLENEIAQWKRDITRISMQHRNSGCQVRLVDFSEPNEISSMRLIKGPDRIIGNQWHYEPSHFTPVLGNCILQALQGNNRACTQGDFGQDLLDGR